VNWEKRFLQHNSGTELETKPNIPYEIIHFEGFINKNDALECEKYFKTAADWLRLKVMFKNNLKIHKYQICLSRSHLV